MLVLVLIGLVAGVITSISPCVLPVLPVVLAAGVSTSETAATETAATVTRWRVRSWRPCLVVGGLVVSFCSATLLGSIVLGALGLPQDLLRIGGVVVLLAVGLGMISRRFGELLERPFVRLPGRPVRPGRNGFVAGLGAGLLYVPCAGPVLATIAVVGATHRVGFDAVVLTLAFGVGVGVPLLVLTLAGDALVQRVGALRAHAPRLRVAGGVVMVLVAAAIALDLTAGLQKQLPGYTAALQSAVEANPDTTERLRALGSGSGPVADPVARAAPAEASCSEGASELVSCGAAPEITGITGWLNTPDNQPLTLAGLRGKVVLLDFWTYSCINCQRTLPYLETWHQEYADAGLVIIGVHTPEFAFEHVPDNIAAQSAALGVRYPVAIDNDYGTWNAYGNRYWPAEYLIDATGAVRHVSFGEGGYDTTESLIRQLLADAAPAATIPQPRQLPAEPEPTSEQTPETYLGYQHDQPVSGEPLVHDTAHVYRAPTVTDPDTFSLSGTWTDGSESLTAGPDARLRLDYQADDVHLVLGGTGTVTVSSDGRPLTTISVMGPPTLYTLARDTGGARTALTVAATPGVQAYAFTFG